MSNFKEKVKKIETFLGQLKQRVLSFEWVRKYYDGPTRKLDLERRLQKEFNLTDDEMTAGKNDGFASVMKSKGQESRVKRKVIWRIMVRATMAAAVSFICDLPQFELSILALTLNVVGFLVDVIFFQLQLFLMIQELEILYVGEVETEYKPLNERSNQADTTVSKLIQGLGWAAKNGIGYVARLFRKSFKRGVIQVFRALGVRVTSEMAETTASMIVTYVVTSLIAGIITYLLFLGMGWRIMTSLRKQTEEEQRKVGAEAA